MTSSSRAMSAKCRPVVGSSRSVSVLAGVAFGEFQGEFDALGFGAGRGWWRTGRGGCSLSLRPSGFAVARYGGDGVEKFAGFFDGHVEDLADVFALYWISRVSRL